MSEGGWFDAEAIESEHFDADMEMADLVAAGNRAARNRKRGICDHGWRQTFNGWNLHLGPVAGALADNGKELRPVWESLKCDESICFHCAAVVPKEPACA